MILLKTLAYFSAAKKKRPNKSIWKQYANETVDASARHFVFISIIHIAPPILHFKIIQFYQQTAPVSEHRSQVKPINLPNAIISLTLPSADGCPQDVLIKRRERQFLELAAICFLFYCRVPSAPTMTFE